MKARKNLSSFFFGFVYAGKGLAESISTQFSIRFHFIATLIAIGFSFYYDLNAIEWCMIIVAIALVWIAELLNTAIEYLTDFVSPEFNNLAGKVKDIAASSALVAAMASISIGLIIFIPKIF